MEFPSPGPNPGLKVSVKAGMAHADRVAVEVLERELVKCGLRVWRDTTHAETFASVTASIDRGLACSMALVAYYSRETNADVDIERRRPRGDARRLGDAVRARHQDVAIRLRVVGAPREAAAVGADARQGA